MQAEQDKKTGTAEAEASEADGQRRREEAEEAMAEDGPVAEAHK